MLRALLKRPEAASGILLMMAAALAMLAANSSFASTYDQLLELPVAVKFGGWELAKPLLLWINDGLMAIFFLLIGLEVKREMLVGKLSTPEQVMLPGIAAIGGMLVPALLYFSTTADDPAALNGWAIPAATDIAFALGILAIAGGDRVPGSLKAFLLALAIFDDLGAIVIIALFYSGDLSTGALLAAAVGLSGLVALNRFGVHNLVSYAVVGLFLWVCVLKSGVHATLAGVAIAFAIPLERDEKKSPLHLLEHELHPWVAYGILPVFAFANAGLSLSGMTLGTLFAPVPLGIFLGLVVGKQMGIFGFSWLAARIGIVRLPSDATWTQLWGVSAICGIGFTMSLFIGSLAFEHLPDTEYLVANRLGILVGSLTAGILGSIILWLAPPKEPLSARELSGTV
jgi:NhaA family Na+:H+ antiporter